MRYNKFMKKFLCLATAAIISCSAVGLSSCKEDKQPESPRYFMPVASYSQYKSSGSEMAEGYGYVMGTDVFLRIAEKDNFATEERYNAFVTLWGEVTQMLTEVDDSISVNVESSCISRFNAAAAGEKVLINKTAYQILTLAQKVYEDTDGYFNPAVYQSVRLYGFDTATVKKPDALPDEESVQAFKVLSESFSQLTLIEEDGRYYATKPETTVKVDGVTHSLKLDLGGIGKGWCADMANLMIEQAGFNYGYFNFSSSTMALKAHTTSEGNNYIIRSRDPRSSGEYAKFLTRDSNLSTSGDYEQAYMFDGVRYCHIINPLTGSPIQTGVASVTVVGGSAAEDDALTTALAAMGKQKAVEYINNNLTDRLVIMLVFEEGQGKIITNQPERVTVVNTAYTLGNMVSDGKIILS